MVYSAWAEWLPDETGAFHLPALPTAADISIDDKESGWLYNRLLLDCIVHTTTVMLRAQIAQQVGAFDEILRRGQDYDYWLRTSQVTPIHKLRGVLSLYRIHKDSITNRPHTVNYGYVVIQKSLNRWGSVGPDGTKTPMHVINKVLGRIWFGYGYLHYKQGDPSLACSAFRRCVGHQPFWYAGWAYWLRSCVRLIARPL